MVTWGDPTSGGKSSKVAQELKAGVSSETLSRISQRERDPFFVCGCLMMFVGG